MEELCERGEAWLPHGDRFGAINDRKVDARELIGGSLTGTGWRMQTCRRAVLLRRRRQADTFVTAKGALEEYHVWAVLVE